jgi:hypothetical protein
LDRLFDYSSPTSTFEPVKVRSVCKAAFYQMLTALSIQFGLLGVGLPTSSIQQLLISVAAHGSPGSGSSAKFP